ncbi:MAG: MFS transporter [Dehalococcoidales bacterium]
MQQQPPISTNANYQRTSNYGWFVVAACSLMIFATYGLIYSYSVFFKPLADYFQWDRASVSLIYSLAVIIRGAAAIGTGWLADKFGARKTMVFCGLMMAAGYLLSSQVSTLWQLFVTYAVVEAIGVSGIFGIGSAIASRWFTKNRGLALGIVASGSGLGTLLLVPGIERLVSAVGWSQAFVYCGIFSGVLMVGGALFLREPPHNAQVLEPAEKASKATVTGAIKDIRLWLLMLCFLLFFFGTQMILVHLVNYATDVGIDPLIAATFISVIGAVSIIGRLSTGVIAEKIGLYNSLAIVCLALAVSFVMLLFTRATWAFYIFAVVFGLAYGGEVTQIPLSIARFFGTRIMATLMGVTLFITGLGGALGPWLAGKIFDVTASYNWAFIIGAAASALSIVLVWFLRRADMGRKITDS